MSKKISMEQKRETQKITELFNSKSSDANQSQKHPSSALSSPDKAQENKKQNAPLENNDNIRIQPKHEYKELLEPLLLEFKSLRESLDSKVSSLEAIIEKQCEEVSSELHKIESTITIHKREVMQECTNRIEKNSHDIKSLLDENKILRCENMSLKERISNIESSQLANNVIITGVPEQQWKPYEVTKQRVLDTVAASIRSKSDDERQENALNVNQININYCTRVGRFRPN